MKCSKKTWASLVIKPLVYTVKSYRCILSKRNQNSGGSMSQKEVRKFNRTFFGSKLKNFMLSLMNYLLIVFVLSQHLQTSLKLIELFKSIPKIICLRNLTISITQVMKIC